MESQKLAKQMIDFQKTLFDNTCNAMIVMQDHSENILNGYIKQFPWITEDVRKPLNDSLALCKGARDNYKNAVNQGFDTFANTIDRGFAEMERLLSPFETPGKEPTVKTATAGPIRAPRPVAEPATPRDKTAAVRKGGAKSPAPAKPVSSKKTAPRPHRQPVKPTSAGPTTVEPLTPIKTQDAKNIAATSNIQQVTATPINLPGQGLPANDPTITETTTSNREIKTDVGN